MSKLSIMLHNLSCQLLARVMLWLDVAREAARDVLQPLLPNLSCPLLKNSLVHICEQLLAILAAKVYFASYLNRASALRAHVAIYDFAAGAAGMHFMYNFGLKSCEPRAMGTHFVHSYEVATLQLELRSALRVGLLH